MAKYDSVVLAPQYVQALSSVASLALGIVTYKVFRIANQINSRNIEMHQRSIDASKTLVDTNMVLKQMDIINSCGARYTDLTKERFELGMSKEEVTETAAKSFYQRFWELQHNQLIFWERGYVEDAIMVSWMEWRKEEWVSNLSLISSPAPQDQTRGFCYKWGWENVKDKFTYTKFVDFMEDVFRHGGRQAMESALIILPICVKRGKTKLDL
jgi:hypothetical protein